MFGAKSTSKILAKAYRSRAARLSKELTKGLRAGAVAIDRAQVENLSGGENPGDYPIPVRTGNLRSSHFFAQRGDRLFVIGNTAAYARAVHEGLDSSDGLGRGNYVHGRRPFLDDAADSVDVLAIAQKRTRKALAIGI